MDLALNDDQVALRQAFAEFFEKESPSNRVRAAEPLGFDEGLWSQLVATGATTMGLPVDAGGGGATMVELALVAREFGRRIAPVPFVEAAVAGIALARAGAREPLSDISEGVRIPTVALTPMVEGVAALVPAGAVADLVVAREDDDLVVLRRPPAPRSHREPTPNLGSLPIADWRRDDAAVGRVVVASGPDADRIYEGALADWKRLMAAALSGIAATALNMGVDYVKERRAFGVPVGWFQAIQHRLADIAVASAGAELLVYEAAWAADEGLDNAAALASMAFLFCSDVAFRACRESLQFHGGYGYTLEYDIQLYFRRAKAWPLALGDPREEYRRVPDLLYPETPGEIDLATDTGRHDPP